MPQRSMKLWTTRALAALALSASLAAGASRADAATAYITNEKGNSISVIDLDKLEVDEDGEGRAAPARHRPQQGQVEDLRRPRRRRHHRDHRRQKRSRRSATCLPAPTRSSCNFSPDGKLMFIANENDALLTAIDLGTREVVTEDSGRSRARGRSRQPRRIDRRQHVRNDQHGALHRLEGEEGRRQRSRRRQGRAMPSTTATEASSG